MTSHISKFRQEADRVKFEQVGCVANILARHSQFSARTLSFVRGWTENAIAHGQIEIFFCDGLPSGYVAWAHLSEDVIARMLYTGYFPHWSEWNEGEYVWIMDMCILPDFLYAAVMDFYCERFREEGHVFWSSEGESGDVVYRFDVKHRKTSSISKYGFVKKIARDARLSA